MNDIVLQYGLWITLSFFAIGAIGALAFQKLPHLSTIWGHGFASLGSLGGIMFSLATLVSGAYFSLHIKTSLPLLTISLRIDPVAALFTLIVSVIALCTSIYGMGYMKHYYGKYNCGAFGFFYNLFIASMLLVFGAQHAIYFLIVWEIMSLASYMLVTFEHREKGTIQAGYLYFTMTHVATACIAFAFLILYRTVGSFDFDVLRTNAWVLPASTQTLVLILALIGFGTKAGIIPLHVWLPKAHPAAPAHVSALMSGVMIKTGIFMLIRFFIELVPTHALWLGITVLTIGAISSLLGVLYALCEHDLKRLLAYHSIENIGIILLGLGSALLFYSLGMRPLMLLALVGALYHTANHAVFKALLFLGAGSVAQGTHTRNIEEYGGLIKRMPWTATCFLVGSMAISGLPPFNGFVSEWITFQGLFLGILSKDVPIAIICIAGVAALAVTGGLAATCFVKAFGITFLAKARSTEAHQAKECGVSMRSALVTLSILTLLMGIGAGTIVPMLSQIAQSITGFTQITPAIEVAGATLDVQNQFSTLSMPLLAIAFIGLLVITMVVVFLYTRRQKVTRGATWDCGAPLTARMEITATGFSRSILTIFQSLVRPTKRLEIEYSDKRGYFPSLYKIEMGFLDVYESYLYGPLNRIIEWASGATKKIQNGNVNLYILYIFLTLIVLVVWTHMQ